MNTDMTNSHSPDQTAKRVLELDEKATKGPWGHQRQSYIVKSGHQSVAEMLTLTSYERDSDATLIATYRTAAPELARAYLELRQAADGMREEVEKAPHDPNCAFEHWMSVYACDCWKSKATARYRALAGEGGKEKDL